MKSNFFEVGIDIVNKKYFKNDFNNFGKRFLTKNEYNEYLKIDQNYKINYLSGRWAAKEAIYKAISKFIKINLIDIEILYDESKKPFCSNINNVSISISHTDNYSIAMAMLNYYKKN